MNLDYRYMLSYINCEELSEINKENINTIIENNIKVNIDKNLLLTLLVICNKVMKIKDINNTLITLSHRQFSDMLAYVSLKSLEYDLSSFFTEEELKSYEFLIDSIILDFSNYLGIK